MDEEIKNIVHELSELEVLEKETQNVLGYIYERKLKLKQYLERFK